MGCSIEEWYVFEDSPQVPDTSESKRGTAVVKRDEDGTYRFAGLGVSGTPCESENLSVGVYEPQPENWNYKKSSVLWLGDEES